MKTWMLSTVICLHSARDVVGGNGTVDMTVSLWKVNGCQYHIPQYTQADALGLYIKCPVRDLRQLNAAIIKKIQDVNVFINTTALGASVVAK